MKKVVYKVPDGKLLKLFFEDNGGIITSLKITGDFFMYPEENIEILERALIGEKLDAATLRAKIEDFLTHNKTKFYGIDADSLITCLCES